jgi:hypothetical protein
MRTEKKTDELFETLCEVCQINPDVYGRGRLNKELSAFRRGGITSERLVRFGNWYAVNDWRGKKRGETPKPATIRERWGDFEEWEGGQQMVAPVVAAEPEPDEPQVEELEEYLQYLYETALESRADLFWSELTPDERAARVATQRDYLLNDPHSRNTIHNADQLNACAEYNAKAKFAADRFSFVEFLKERAATKNAA